MLFYFKCQSSLTLLQLLNTILLLPPVVSAQLVLWLSCLIVPLLSFTLMGNPLNRHVTQMAQAKNQTSFVKQVTDRLSAVPTVEATEAVASAKIGV